MTHVGQHLARRLDGPRHLGIDLHADDFVEHNPDPELRRCLSRQRGVRFRWLRNDEGIAGLGDGNAIEHASDVAHGPGLDEIDGEAESALIDHRANRNPTARGLESNTATQACRDADRTTDIRAVRERHDRRSYSRLSTTTGATRRVALLPRIRRVAEHHALRGGRHGVFRRGGATEDVDTGGLEHVDEICPGFDRHALAQTGAEFDLAGLFMPEDVLDEKWHAAERSIAQPRLDRKSIV